MNFLVKLSQNNKVIVPIVVVMALTIFGGSYLIQNNRQVARQEAEQQQAETEAKDDNLVAVEEIKEAEPEPEVEKAQEDTEAAEKTEEDAYDDEKYEDKKWSTTDIKIVINSNDVVVSIETSKSGECYIKQLVNSEWKRSETVSSVNKKCSFANIIEPDATKLIAVFVSDDGTNKGYADEKLSD